MLSALPTEYVTPGTRLVWRDLTGWLEAASRINSRRASEARHHAVAAHLAALPVALVSGCDAPDTLARALAWWIHGPSGFCRPPRGHRAGAPQTALIVAARNRLTQLARAADRAGVPDGHNWRTVHATAAPSERERNASVP